MPVMDKDKKTEEVHENEVEKRRNAVKNEQEKSPQKLIPFLKVKAEFHQSRIDTLNEKIAVREDKITRNKAKIEKLSAKADKLADRNEMLKNAFGNNPVVQKIIKSNEQKIDSIRNEKIPKRQDKIKVHENKINQLSEKRDKIQHKFNRVAALSNVISSFSIRHNSERKEVFADAMDKLNIANADCLTDKLNALQKQKQQLVDTYNLPDTSAVDKINLAAKIRTVNDKIEDIGNKLSKLTLSENHFEKQPEKKIYAAIKLTSDKLSEMSDDFNVPKLSVNVMETAGQVENMNLSQINSIADNYLKNTEMSIEDDYNSIDGIINNGTKEELESKRNEIQQNIEAEMELVSNPYVREDIREYAKEDIELLKADLQKIDNALGEFSDKETEKKMPEKEVTAFKKINPDYYKSLESENRSVSIETTEIANKIMAELDKKDIQYSAVERKNEFTAITVSKADAKAYKEISSQIKNERAAEVVSPDFCKKKPDKEVREEKPVQTKNDNKTQKKPTYISRDTLKKSAQRLKNNKSQEQPKSNSMKQELN